MFMFISMWMRSMIVDPKKTAVNLKADNVKLGCNVNNLT